MGDELKTIEEWEKEFDIKIYDPDGFDRSDPHLYERLFSKQEFIDRSMYSTCIFGPTHTKKWKELAERGHSSD